MAALHETRPADAASRSRPGFRLPALTVVPLDPERRPAPTEDWAALLRAVAQRQDCEAFARLFAHFAPRLKRHLMLGGSPEAQAEELAQEALAAVWRKAAQFDPAQAAASTWIFTIVRNLRVDLLRRHELGERSGEVLDFDDLEADEPAADERLHAIRLGERLRVALTQLSPQQQRLLRLSFYDGEPHVRIAAELGIPLGTVKSRVRLAVSQLRRLLES